MKRKSDKKLFVERICVGMKIHTPKGDGIVESVIEDIHCHVNVRVNGESHNFMLYNELTNLNND